MNTDVFICTDVYPAREEPIEGVTGKLISDITERFGHKNVHYISDKTKVPEFLINIVKDDDIVVTMGAGDIWKIGNKFIEMLEKKRK